MAAYSISFFLVLGIFHATIVLQTAHQSIHTGIYLTLPTILLCFRWVIHIFICIVADDDDDDVLENQSTMSIVLLEKFRKIFYYNWILIFSVLPRKQKKKPFQRFGLINSFSKNRNSPPPPVHNLFLASHVRCNHQRCWLYLPKFQVML